MKMNEREDARKEVNMSIVAYMTYMSDKLTYMLKANLPFYVYYAVFFVMIFFLSELLTIEVQIQGI
jgi:hypothetical protein